MNKFHIFNALIVNDYTTFQGEVFIADGLIQKINKELKSATPAGYEAIDAEGLYLLPGVIDDQVHFREPGLEEKGTIATESRAAVAGGVTSFMEMPNTKPPVLSQELLEKKYFIAAKESAANYSFYMGTSNDNIDEVLKTPLHSVCGVKIFLGASTGNLLVDNEKTIERLFSESPHIIAAHCEDEATIKRNLQYYSSLPPKEIDASVHPLIRSVEACYASSSRAIALARKKQTRLHVLHVSTAAELNLFDNHLPLEQKRITAEVCVHHLWFTADHYSTLGNLIKWNPAIKSVENRKALRNGLREGFLDIVATDHAPHQLFEKQKSFFEAPSGGPLVQHSLQAMITLCDNALWTLEDVVDFMCHKPARLFAVKQRGFIREGYYADLILLDLKTPYNVTQENILYKCKWSPFDGTQFSSTIVKTFVSGQLAWSNGKLIASQGMRMEFDRN